MKKFWEEYVVYIAWVQALTAMLGSLYFSEVLHVVPCILCWYQRILMFPLVLVIAVGILRKDIKIYQYVLPLSILGAIVALYHSLLQAGIISEQLSPCTVSAPCVTKFSGYFGFITIPVMSLTAFVVITVCMLIYRKSSQK